MTEPQAPESEVVRKLEKTEIRAANSAFRSRLARAFSRYPTIRQMISKDRWTDPSGTESVKPSRHPDWIHTISRSGLELIVRSELIGRKLNSDNLIVLLPEDNPGIGFTKAVQGNVVEVLSDTSDVLPEAESFISRIESQFGQKQK